MNLRRHIPLLLILALAAGLRLGLLAAASPGGAVTPDSDDYLQLAASIAGEGTFQRDGQPELFRTPGYPLLLTIGDPGGVLSPAAEAPQALPTAALVAQVLIDVALAAVVYALAAMLLNRRVALLAAGLQAVTPLAIAASCRVLSDSVYSFVFTAAVLLMVGHLKTRRIWPLVAAGIALGASIYVRPVGQVMVMVFALAALLPWGGPAVQLRRRLFHAATLVVIVAAVMAPWLIRNAAVADYYGFSSFASDSMFRYSASRVLARREGMPVEDAREQLLAEEREYAGDHPDASAGEMARWRARRGREILLNDGASYAAMHARGSIGFFLPGATDVLEVAGVTSDQRGTLGVLQQRGIAAAVRHYFGGNTWAMILTGLMILVPLAKFAGVAVCVWRRARLRMPAWSWLLLLVVAVSVLLGGPASMGRFRLPVEPVFSVAAAAGLLSVTDWLRRRRGSVAA